MSGLAASAANRVKRQRDSLAVTTKAITEMEKAMVAVTSPQIDLEEVVSRSPEGEVPESRGRGRRAPGP